MHDKRFPLRLKLINKQNNFISKMRYELICNNQSIIYIILNQVSCRFSSEHYFTTSFEKSVIFKCYFTEHTSQGCPHMVLISQLSQLKQCG